MTIDGGFDNPVPAVEKPMAQEIKIGLANQAKEIFRGVYDTAFELDTKTKTAVEGIQGLNQRLSTTLHNADPREPGYKQLVYGVEPVLSKIRNGLNRLIENPGIASSERNKIGGHIEEVLVRIVGESDPKKIEEMAAEALGIFQTSINRLNDYQQGTSEAGKQIKNGAEENSEATTQIFRRLQNETRQDLRQGFIGSYDINSRRMTEYVGDAFRSLSRGEQILLDRTIGGFAHFQRILGQMIEVTVKEQRETVKQNVVISKVVTT